MNICLLRSLTVKGKKMIADFVKDGEEAHV